MPNTYQRIPTRGPAYDPAEKRQRVADYVDGNTLSYEGTTVSGTPAVIDFHTDSGGQQAHYGYLINDGTGNLTVEYSFDGTTYGGVHTIKVGEQVDLSHFSINRMRISYVDDAADYRVLLM